MIVVLVNAYALNGMGMECVQLFRQISVDMLNESIYINVLNGCSHSGLINEALEISERIPPENRTEKIYTTMVKIFLFSCDLHFLLVDQRTGRRF